MPALHDIQRMLRDHLLSAPDAGVPPWVIAPVAQAAERLGVYRATVIDTLVRALGLSFPAVQRLVGAEFFEGAAQVFARGHLPHCADLARYGAEFPGFLETFVPSAGLKYLPDTAHLDLAAARALHAPDAAPLPLAALAEVAADAGHIRFCPHPSLSLLRSEFPIDDIWRAVLAQDDVAMGAIDLVSGPVHLVVERVDDHVQVSRLSRDEWSASAALMQGRTLAQVMDLELAGVDLPALLAAHLAAGRFAGFQVLDF